MNSPHQDFRHWIAYNPGLNNQYELRNLYNTLKHDVAIEGFRCDKIIDNDNICYRITQIGNDSSLILTEYTKHSMISYLENYYLRQEQTPAETTRRALNGENESTVEELPYFMDPKYIDTTVTQKLQLPLSRWFYNSNTRKHVIGYGMVSIIFAQIVLIPANVFSYKFPDFFKYLFPLIFVVIQYYAVRNYKNHFLRGGLLYRTVWSITFWLFLMIFGFIGIEVSLIDAISDGEIGAGMVVIPVVLFVLSLGMGWFFSIFIYYMNGGKVVTDPSKVEVIKNVKP